MLRFKLAEIMAKYRITGEKLRDKIGLSKQGMSNLKNSDKLPEIGSDRLCQLAKSISELSGHRINPLDLIEYTEELN